MDPVYIDSVGITHFGASERGLLELLQDAGQTALQDGALPEAVFVGSMSPEALGYVSNLATAAAHALGLAGTPAIRVETASSSGAAVLAVAASAIASGQYQRVLAIAGEKMTGLPTPQITRVLAEVIDQSERGMGLTMPAMAALIARAYAHHNHIDAERLGGLLARIAIKAHANGALNPWAHFQKPITLDAYKGARQVAEPLGLFDCAPISDGAAAVMLTSHRTDVRIAGLGQGTDTPSICGRSTLTGFPATVRAARKAYRMAGFGPEAVDFAEVHDAFTVFELTGVQDLGLFDGKGAVEAVEEEQTGLRGHLPVNPSGGLKSRGHPVGASGLAQIVEVALQMRGQAGARQLERTSRALTHSIGGPGSNNFVVLLERTDAQAAMAQAPSLAKPGDGEPSAGQTSSNGHGKGIAGNGAKDGTRSHHAPSAGSIESFTVLHAPAEGFPAPLTLALVATPEGGRILAASPAEERLHIGARASATHVEGKWLLTLLPPRKLSFRWMAARASRARRFLRRGPAPMAKH